MASGIIIGFIYGVVRVHYEHPAPVAHIRKRYFNTATSFINYLSTTWGVVLDKMSELINDRL